MTLETSARRTSALAVALILLLAGCRADVPTSASPTSVDSFLPPAPPRYVGQSSVDYSGTWLGEGHGDACDAVIQPCRVNGAPRSVRISVSQVGTDLTGTFDETPFVGYVTASLGIFALTSFGGFLLDHSEDGFTGIVVGDTVRDGLRTRTDRLRVTSLRRQ